MAYIEEFLRLVEAAEKAREALLATFDADVWLALPYGYHRSARRLMQTIGPVI